MCFTVLESWNDVRRTGLLTVFFIIVDAWIGFMKTGSGFLWVSNLNTGPQNLSYYKWAPKEPYQNRGAVVLWKTHNFMWNDVPVSSEYHFVCKKVCIHLCCFNDCNSFWIFTVPVHGLLYLNMSELQNRSSYVFWFCLVLFFVPTELRIFTH